MKLPFIDDLLNSLTMYRLTLYVLCGLIGVAIVEGFFGVLPYSPIDIAIEACAAIISCYIGNKILAKFFGAVTNSESALITALILTLIVPVKFPHNFTFFILVSGFAMGMKYLPTIDKRHVFNPAGAAVAAIALLTPEHVATWWVGTAAMLPFVLVGGFLIMRKTQREQMIGTFLVVYLSIAGAFAFIHFGSLDAIVTSWKQSLLSSALIFFATVMLTEPLTSPATEKLQKWYSTIVAFLYATPQMRLFGLVLTPELALSAGNIFSYIVSPKYRLTLTLKNIFLAAKDTYVFAFHKIDKFAFVPGQYMEWTLPHKHTDDRGNRRYFSLASSPGEDIQIAVRFNEPSSSYKKALVNMQKGDQLIASSLSGSFTMPEDKTTPLVFVAGGIGIAPFRSIVQDVIDKKLHVDIIILYSNRTITEIAFADIFEKAKEFGVQTIYTLTDKEHIPADWTGGVGYFTSDAVTRFVPDYAKRLFYISGPQLMVQRLEETLRGMSIPKNHIKTDYFPGYAEK